MRFHLHADLTVEANGIIDAMRVVRDGFAQDYKEAIEEIADDSKNHRSWFCGKIRLEPELHDARPDGGQERTPLS